MIRSRRNILAVSLAAAIVCLLTPLVASAQQTRERNREEGLRETDRFIRAGEQATAAVGTAKTEVERTLTAYNTLISQPSSDMRRDYRNLMRSVDSMKNRRVTEATTRVGAMQAAADVYYQGRGLTIKDIQDEQLRSQAQQRMEQNKKDFDGVLAALREAGSALEPVRKQLADQITFLGSDLNPSATASLKPQAEKLNANGKVVFATTDAAITRANDFFNALRSQP